MIQSWTKQRSMRFLLAGSLLIVGLMVAYLLLHEHGFAFASALFAVGLAALVGVGKLASP